MCLLLFRQGEKDLEKPIKHKARTSQNRKLPILQPHCCSTDPALTSLQPSSWDILQCSAQAVCCRGCSCVLVLGCHLGIRHFLGVLTDVPLPTAPSASSYFGTVVRQKSPLHHLLSRACSLRHNFKTVHGHGDFQSHWRAQGLHFCFPSPWLNGL